MTISVDNLSLGVSLSAVNDKAIELFGVPIHNYFLRIFSGNGIFALLAIIIPLLSLVYLLISVRKNLKYSYIIFSALFAQLLMINFYPGSSLKPIALNIGLILAYLSMYFEANKNIFISKKIKRAQ